MSGSLSAAAKRASTARRPSLEDADDGSFTWNQPEAFL